MEVRGGGEEEVGAERDRLGRETAHPDPVHCWEEAEIRTAAEGETGISWERMARTRENSLHPLKWVGVRSTRQKYAQATWPAIAQFHAN